MVASLTVEGEATALVVHRRADAAGAPLATDAAHHEPHLDWALRLSTSERQQLRRHLAWIVAARPGMPELTQRVSTLPAAQRCVLAELLGAVAGRDRHLTRAAIMTLTEFYRWLGVRETGASNDGQTHAGGAPAPEPVTIRAADAVASGFVIPPPALPPDRFEPAAVTLDPARLKTTLAETVAVAAVLAAIFSNDEPTLAPPSVDANPARTVGGLSDTHAALARSLAQRRAWRRADVETLARGLGLLPDGALEQINEAACACCGAPLCDGDDPIEVNPSVVQDLVV